MKYIIFLLLILVPLKILPAKINKSYAAEKIIYSKIIKIDAKLDKNYAYHLSNAIYIASIKYKINYNILVAILAQESMFNLRAISNTHDYSIGQINIKNIKKYRFSRYKLLTDVVYSVDCSGLLLNKIYNKYGKLDKNWWARYHSNNYYSRLYYIKLVKRYML